MANNIPDYTVILAAGKGSRMGQNTCPKVCFEVNGVPAVNRALRIYESCGIRQNVLVVGNLAGQVIETVGKEFPNTAFVYQAEQLGTAHALRCALRGLPTIPENADLLIAAGDRIIEQSVLEQLFDLYYTSGADMALVTLLCKPDSGQGRIPRDADGNPVAVIEMADIRQHRVYRTLRELPPGVYPKKELFELLCKNFFGAGGEVKPQKGMNAFGELWTFLQEKGEVSSRELQKFCPKEMTSFRFETRSGNLELTPDEAQAISNGNTSVYLVKCRILKEALARLTRDNAQKEEYLSDLVGFVYRKKGVVRMLPVDNPAQVLGFNNPAELLEMEKILKTGHAGTELPVYNPDEFLPLKRWRELFEDPAYLRGFNQIYSEDASIQSRQIEMIRQVLKCAAGKFEPDTVIGLVRSPGRLNVMGRHVDHQGGNCNLMTISFETIMLVHPRRDDRVTLNHCDPEHFPGCEFGIREMVSELPWEDWNSVVNSSKLAKMIQEYGVDWSYYIKAAILRLQKKFPARPLFGMDLVIGGNIPMAAGLSSSSSLVVGSAEAAVAVNQLNTFPSQLVTLCGEGEWFVGTRGGSADHAAVKMGRCGSVVKVRFFEFAVEDTVPFPENYAMVVCDSGIKARKSSDAKDQFNHRISCYRIGFKLIQKYCPQYRAVLHHLRDVNVRNLQIPLSGIYKILLMLPESATREELQKLLPEENIETMCAGHKVPADGRYPIRGVVLFGLSEAERSAAYADALRRGDMAEIGRMMKVSHDGDRVVTFDENWNQTPFHAPVDNSYLLERLTDLESGDPDRVIRSQLIWQPGSYSCSIPEIDRMVEAATRTKGVAGAQLAGAGLGGCMMVLAEQDAITQLVENLKQRYYIPAGIPDSILVCRPIAGAGLLNVREKQA